MVIPLPEGTYTVDAAKVFIPFDPSIDSLLDRPASLVVDIVPFLLKIGSDLIVIDPGLGFTDEQYGFTIYRNLSRAGFKPDDVSLVLLSHLHKDHAGGICYKGDSSFNLMFPKAKYFCQEKEMELALSKHTSSYEHEKLQFLKASKQLNMLNGNGNINPHIRYEVSGGHTPYHQVFYMEDESKDYFFGGDVLPQSSQIFRKFIAKYDFDGAKSAQLRAQYGRNGAATGLIFLFFHDAKTPMAKIQNAGDHLMIEPTV